MARKIKHQIAIAGWAGTGTTTAAKGVLLRLGEPWRIVRPASDTFRSLAVARYPDKDHSSALAQFERDACKDLSIDKACDDSVAALAASEEFFIVDARLGARFAPDALRVLLYCNDDALRYQRVASRDGVDFCTAAKETVDREASAKRRYLELYGVQIEDLEYDLKIDTGRLWEADVINLIVEKFYQLAI